MIAAHNRSKTSTNLLYSNVIWPLLFKCFFFCDIDLVIDVDIEIFILSVKNSVGVWGIAMKTNPPSLSKDKYQPCFMYC